MRIEVPQKDQTPEGVIPAAGSNKKGTALFLVPSFASGSLEGIVQAVPNLTYGKARELAEQCVAFKWVPPELASYESIVAGCPSEGKRCVHGSQCEAGCMCSSVGPGDKYCNSINTPISALSR